MKKKTGSAEQLKQESKKLAHTSFLAMAGVLLSRASGVIRTLVTNSTYGAHTALDAFNASFRFPNSLRDLFADGALSAAFVKVLIDAQAKDQEAERKLISVIIGFFIVVTGLIALLGAIFSYEFMTLITDERFKNSGGLVLASNLFKILAFYLPITMLNAVAMAILSVLGQTFRAMNGSIFLSIGMILGALAFGPIFTYEGINSIYGLALGSMLGVIGQLIYQFIPILKLKLLIFPCFNPKIWFSYKPLREVLILMAPRTLGQGAMTIALLVNTMFAIQIGAGVLTYIMTAITIIQVPIGLFGVATGFAAHPVMTKAILEGDKKRFSKLLIDSLQTSMWLAAITSAGFALFIVPLYNIVFQYGKIHYNDTIQNSIAVCAYSIGIIFSSGSKVILNAFYSLNYTRQIMFNAIIYLIINVLLSYYLAPRLGIIGLGLSYGTATALDFLLNYVFLKRVYSKKQGGNPYEAGGRYVGYFMIFMGFLSFFIGISGLIFIHYVWGVYPKLLFIGTLTRLNSCVYLVVIGLIYIALIVVIIKKFGPDNLKTVINKIFKKIN